MDRETLFFKCPKCGIYGRAGKECEFCGEPVVETEEGRTFDSLFPSIQTIPADEFAERISKFHRVESFQNNVAIAVFGELRGLINRNGEMILPLQYEEIINDRPGIIQLKVSGHWYTLNADEFVFYRYENNERVSGEFKREFHEGQLCFHSYPDDFIFDVKSCRRILSVNWPAHIRMLLDGYILRKDDPERSSSFYQSHIYSLISVDGTVIHPFDDPIRLRPIHYDDPYKEEFYDPDALCLSGDLPEIKKPLSWYSLGKNTFAYKLNSSESLEKQYKRMMQQFRSDYEQEIQRARKKVRAIFFGTAVAIVVMIFLFLEFFWA